MSRRPYSPCTYTCVWYFLRTWNDREQAADHGDLTEALETAITQSAPEAKQRVNDFLEGRAERVIAP